MIKLKKITLMSKITATKLFRTKMNQILTKYLKKTRKVYHNKQILKFIFQILLQEVKSPSKNGFLTSIATVINQSHEHNLIMMILSFLVLIYLSKKI